MSNPIRLFENLRDMYLRYLDSPFDLRYADLTAERRQLLDQDGRIYRRPLIEPVPAYRSSGQTFSQAIQSLLELHLDGVRDALRTVRIASHAHRKEPPACHFTVTRCRRTS